MKSRISLSLSLLLVIVTWFTACAGSKELGQSFRPTAAGFTFDRSGRAVTIPIKETISDWRVNCNRTRAVVWGQAEDLAEVGAPPVARVYILNLEKEEVISVYTVTRGPYEVIFSQDLKHASVDDYVIDQASGEIVGMTEDIKLVAESCNASPVTAADDS